MSVKLANKGNTKVSRDGSNITVTLYDTQIVSATPETIRLNTGGYETITTKNRMNQAADEYGLGYQVYNIKGIWYVKTAGNVLEFAENAVSFKRGN